MKHNNIGIGLSLAGTLLMSIAESTPTLAGPVLSCAGGMNVVIGMLREAPYAILAESSDQKASELGKIVIEEKIKVDKRNGRESAEDRRSLKRLDDVMAKSQWKFVNLIQTGYDKGLNRYDCEGTVEVVLTYTDSRVSVNIDAPIVVDYFVTPNLAPGNDEFVAGLKRVGSVTIGSDK